MKIVAETQESNPILQPHSNAVVPHTISDHTMAVQTSVMVDGKWVNLVDTNDINNLDLDLHKVANVVQDQVSKIADVESNANSAVEQAEAAQEASNTNQVAIANMDSAVKAAQANITSQSATVDTIQTDLSAAKQQIKDAEGQIDAANSDIEQAQSDIKANANAISDNAGNIASVTSTASKLSSNMTDAQGDISTLQQLATGFKADIADNEGNISSLQTSVKGLSDTVSDNKGDISTLKNTTSGLSSTVATKANQSDLNTTNSNVNSLTNTVNGLNSTVFNLSSDNTTNKQNISTLQNTANGFTNTVATLQTQVNNSAVGTNLLTDTSGDLQTKQLTNSFNSGPQATNGSYQIKLFKGQTYTYRAWLDNTNGPDVAFVNVRFTPVGGSDFNLDNGTLVAQGETGYSTGLITPPADGYARFSPFAYWSPETCLVGWKEEKLEKGSVATDWCPNPADNATVTSVSTLTNTVNGLSSTVIDNKGDISTLKNTTSGLSSTIAQVSNTAGQNTTLISNLTQTVDGIQSTVKNKADQSTVSQLANQMLAKVSTDDFQSEIALIQNDLNLRVSKGDIISQLNLEAGGDGLIQVANGKGKLFIDADSVVISGEEFIPSAAITDIAADKITSGTLDAGAIRVVNLTADSIHGGTLDMGSMNVKNLSANDIAGGTLESVVVKTGTSDQYFQTSQNNIYWVKKDGTSLLGNDTYLNDCNGLTIADTNNILLTTWGGATVNEDGSITNNSGNSGHPKIVVDKEGSWNPEDPFGSDWYNGPGNTEIVQWVGNKEYSLLENSKGFLIRLDDSNNKSEFDIQKDNHIGAYFGTGDNGNQINFIFGGDGSGFNVNGSLRVTGSKNSVVQTAQGWLAINAYETAEYYFGDIGESNTGNQSKVTIGIDRIFNETVNTNIQYQVFITPYSDAHVWVEQRYHNRFIVCSDKPNAEFGWEIKAKRKGYEDHRLRKVDTDFEPSSALNKGDF